MIILCDGLVFGESDYGSYSFWRLWYGGGFFFFGGGGEVVKRGFCYFLVDVLYILYFYRRMICK